MWLKFSCETEGIGNQYCSGNILFLYAVQFLCCVSQCSGFQLFVITHLIRSFIATRLLLWSGMARHGSWVVFPTILLWHRPISSQTLFSFIEIDCFCILWNETSLYWCNVFYVHKKVLSSITNKVLWSGFCGYLIFLLLVFFVSSGYQVCTLLWRWIKCL
jgi:hypothetical protein